MIKSHTIPLWPHQNCNKIIKQPSEPAEIKLNRSLTTTELKKPHPSRLVAGVETRNRLLPHTCVVDKNSGGISWEQGVPAPQQEPQPRVPEPGRLSPHNSWLQNPARMDWVCGRKQLESQAVPPHMNLLRFTPSELQHWSSSLKGTSGRQRGTEVSGIKARAGGTALSQTER